MLTETEKIQRLRELDWAATHATKVANGMVRGSDRVAGAALLAAVNRIAVDWVGRKLTDEEFTG